MMCDGRQREEAGGREEADPGYRIKNKNPTQRCREKTQCFTMFRLFARLHLLSSDFSLL